jgi:tRNA modification GTPase
LEKGGSVTRETMTTETIAAVATPHGKGALAVIRISGANAFGISARCLVEREKFEKAPSRRVMLYKVKFPGTEKAVDEITAIKYAAPKSFTGENMVEMVCHGGPVVVRGIMAALLSAGARPAGPGEFSRRAFTNGKISLLRAEAIRGLIESSGEAEMACAQKLYHDGETVFGRWKAMVMDLLADREAAIEFEEEEHVAGKRGTGKEMVRMFLKSLQREIEKRKAIKTVEEGMSIVIAGPANAGKSTLFNRMVGHDRAIIHPDPGTTRDSISEKIWIGGHEITLIDSAGFRGISKTIELEGMERSRRAISKAQLVLWMTAANETMNMDEERELALCAGKKAYGIINKTDVFPGEKKEAIFKAKGMKTSLISLKTGENVEDAIKEIENMVKEIFEKIEVPDFLLNQRLEYIAEQLLHEITLAEKAWEQAELAAEHLKTGVDLFDDLFGKTTSEDVLNRIFETFCIGK